HEKAAAAQDAGAFKDQIAAIKVTDADGNTNYVTEDGGIRRGGTVESMAAIKPAFKEDGVIHAGNSSQISDGAAALLIMSAEKAKELGLKPLARLHTGVLAGADPVMMLSAPIPATQKALAKSGLSVGDIGVFEVNEAFAPVPMAWLKDIGADENKLNPNGGAIALGHPLGGSGARIMTTLLHHMRDNGIQYGFQTMCETINRPEARNAVNQAVSIGVGDALQAAQDDPEIRAVVITGSGDKSFCAGADLKALSRGENLFHPDHTEWGFAGYVSHFIDKPTIAAVNGTALGGGTELALASDLVVAEDSAKFGLPEVKRGLIAGAGGVFRIVDQLPRKVALELMFTGEPMTSADALRWGLINQVVPDGSGSSAVDAALKLAERITSNAPLAVQASKRVAYGADDGVVTAEEDGWRRTNREFVTLLQSEDAKEGPLAFAQKRQPVWKAK
ncbi:hypothetical protein FZI93_04425, partial [Mycobacterium sp. CBMA361]|nr:hypothetical protein [Mycolicibacterium sp. CBMA 361]